MVRRTGSTLLLLLFSAGSVSTQEIRGRVSDVSTDASLDVTLLTVLGSDSALVGMAVTDTSGRFVLQIPPAEGVKVRAERLGYATVESVPLTFAPGDTLRLEIRLRLQPIALDEIEAEAEKQIAPHLAGFLRRQRTGFGRYAGPAEIAQRRFNSAVDLVLQVDGTRFQPAGVNYRALLGRRPPKGLEPTSALCTPLVYVDGAPVPETLKAQTGGAEAVPLDWYATPSEIRAVEIYKNPAEAPPQYQTSNFMGECVILLVWTDWAFRMGRWRPKAE